MMKDKSLWFEIDTKIVHNSKSFAFYITFSMIFGIFLVILYVFLSRAIKKRTNKFY